MDISKQTKIQHLFWRAGFGSAPKEIQESRSHPHGQLVAKLLEDSKQFEPLKINDPRFLSVTEFRALSKEAQQQNRKEWKKILKHFNVQWLQKMTTTKQQLREKMTLFWHGHFACRINNPWLMEQLNNVIRQHALGNFNELLMAVSKEPAMLKFLNNQQNRKAQPNENFARELLELFTLGAGNYSENDIKEAARAFTGWRANKEGKFQFNKKAHDFGKKSFFGQSGNFGGEDIIEIVLQKRQTARFITSKIYSYFVNEKFNEEIISELTDKFFDSGYDIEFLMREIFGSPWFYNEANIGAKIKSPVELLAGLMKTFNIFFQNERALILLQSALGQLLFFPPNVAGWPGGRSWIDSSTLMLRLKIPTLIFRNENLEINALDENGQQLFDYQLKIKGLRKLTANLDFDEFVESFKNLNQENSLSNLREFLLQKNWNVNEKKELNEQTEFLKATLKILSSPEYQLC